MPARISRCVLSLTLFMVLLTLTPIADIEGIAAQSITAVSDTERRGMLVAGTPHSPIVIDGDANFSATALLEGWPGDGSHGNPYIIDGLDIELGGAVGNCISIRNTRVHFTIRNCNLIGASGEDFGAGINIENVTHGELLNNIVEGNRLGIFVANSHYSAISDNTCFNNTESGIWLTGSDSNTVVNNTCYRNLWGIKLGGDPMTGGEGAHSNNVADNVCNNNYIGIYLYRSESNTLDNNTCNYNRYTGIYNFWSWKCTVVNNNCSNNIGQGIYLDGSGDNTVANNICTNNEVGIFILDSYSNNVFNNICFNNSNGIALSSSSSNTVANNTCTNNNEWGIFIWDSDSNIVTDNTYSGIFLDESDHNTLANNICNSNDIGIYLYRSDNNTVTSNICNKNRIGIYLNRSDNNTVTHNTCLNNTEDDIYLDDSESNTVENNITTLSKESVYLVLLLIGFGGITLLGTGWWKVSARSVKDYIIAPTSYMIASWFSKRRVDQDEVIVPINYRISSWFRMRKAFTHIDTDETLTPDSSD